MMSIKKRNLNEKMRIQTDQEFQQNEIRKVNSKCNVEMFTSKICGGKTFSPKKQNKA